MKKAFGVLTIILFTSPFVASSQTTPGRLQQLIEEKGNKFIKEKQAVALPADIKNKLNVPANRILQK